MVFVSSVFGIMIVLDNSQEGSESIETISPILVQPPSIPQPALTPKKEAVPTVQKSFEPVVSITKSSSKTKVVHSSSGGSQVQPSQPQPTNTSILGSAPPITPINANEQEKLQFILDSRLEHFKLPQDTSILITFFDRTDGYLLAGWNIMPYTGQDYDLKLTFGDYNINSLMSDFCGTAKKIRDSQDYSWTLNKDKISLALKYGSLIKLKDMCN